MVTRLSRFRRSESGVTMVEGLIVFPLVLIMIMAFVEFGYGVFQWQQTGRAVAIGARLAAVSNPIATNFADLGSDYVSSTTLIIGDPVPATVRRVSCTGAAPTGTVLACGTGFNRILYGSDNRCNLNHGTSVPGMCDLNPMIKPENVVITYTRDGLGYVGRDTGPVVSVTVHLRNMTFSYFLIGRLFGFTSVPMRPNPVTFTGEDLATCNNPTRTASNFSTPCP